MQSNTGRLIMVAGFVPTKITCDYVENFWLFFACNYDMCCALFQGSMDVITLDLFYTICHNSYEPKHLR